MTQYCNQQTVRQFQQQGVTVLRGLFCDWVDALRDGIAANMAEPNPNARIYKDRRSRWPFLCGLLQLATNLTVSGLYLQFACRPNRGRVNAEQAGAVIP